jgi:hypothetical protein
MDDKCYHVSDVYRYSASGLEYVTSFKIHCRLYQTSICRGFWSRPPRGVLVERNNSYSQQLQERFLFETALVSNLIRFSSNCFVVYWIHHTMFSIVRHETRKLELGECWEEFIMFLVWWGTRARWTLHVIVFVEGTTNVTMSVFAVMVPAV